MIDSAPEAQFTDRQIIKNLFVLCSGFLFLYIAYDALFMLQSTMNREQGIGVACQAIVYSFFCLCSLLLPKYIIKKLGSKVTLTIGMFACVPYVAANFYPHWAVMVPCALSAGFGSSLLWASQCTYLNEISVLYAKHQFLKTHSSRGSSFSCDKSSSIQFNWVNNKALNNKESQTSAINDPRTNINKKDEVNEETFQNTQNSEKCLESSSEKESSAYSRMVESWTARFFGFHGMAYMATRIISNLMSFYLLQKDAPDSKFSNSTCVCGANFCNVESECFAHNVEPPSTEVRYILTGICVVIGLFSVFLVGIFLDPLKMGKEEVSFSLDFMLSTFRQARKKRQILLIPLCFYVGMIQGFYTGDFTKSYIACAWGTYHVGLVSICYGATCALASLASGWMVKRFNRLPVFILAGAVNLASIIIFLMWHPKPKKPAMFFIAAGMWGTSTGILWSQLRAFVGVLFKKDEEAAFGAYYLWYSLGWCLSFAYSNYFCTYVKVYVLLAVSSVGIIGYLTVEIPLVLNKVK
ncbi:protein unc-93 homolog A-like [Uloborus diversus]|uniref:protein unc-93 homolog A-like n=1 Tax=Uloborus diversus TaxID=327109 RepID=UPI002409B18A|nr:protein unc-93 homolog A-like [Uloborus diversus]